MTAQSATTTIDLLPLKTAIRYIDAHPKRWNQNRWGIKRTTDPQDTACGTAFCVAGFIIHQAPGWSESWSRGQWDDSDYITLDWACPPDGGTVLPGVAAKMILGVMTLDHGTIHYTVSQLLSELFDAGNSRADIQLFAQDIAHALGEEWDVPLPDWADEDDTRRHQQYLEDLYQDWDDSDPYDEDED